MGRHKARKRNQRSLVYEICRLAADHEQLTQEREIAEEGEVENTRDPQEIDRETDVIIDQVLHAAQRLRILLYPDDEE